MGREAKILLGMLGLLAGVFCGVLSMKLFVHRPPAGVGPDVRPAFAFESAGPPASAWPVLPAAAFAAAPPLSIASEASATSEDRRAEWGKGGPDGPAIHTADSGEPRLGDGLPGRDAEGTAGRFAEAARAPVGRRTDPSVLQAGYELPASAPAEAESATALAASTRPGTQPGAEPHRDVEGTVSVTGFPDPTTLNPAVATAAPRAATPVYVVQPGDSWWHVAERAYGDGRLYRALFAWNKAADARVSLTPGTQLEVPPLDRLTAAWPGLAPR